MNQNWIIYPHWGKTPTPNGGRTTNELALRVAERILDTHAARDVLYPVQLRVMRSLSGK